MELATLHRDYHLDPQVCHFFNPNSANATYLNLHSGPVTPTANCLDAHLDIALDAQTAARREIHVFNAKNTYLIESNRHYTVTPRPLPQGKDG